MEFRLSINLIWKKNENVTVINFYLKFRMPVNFEFHQDSTDVLPASVILLPENLAD